MSKTTAPAAAEDSSAVAEAGAPRERTFSIGARTTRLGSTFLLSIGGATLVALLGLVFTDVVMRNAFNAPLKDVTEISVYWLMVPVVFIGIWWAEVVRDHISVTMLTDHLGAKTARLAQIIVSVILVAFLLYLAYVNLDHAIYRAAQGEYIGANQTPIWPGRFIVAGGYLLYALVITTRTINAVRGRQTAPIETELDEAGIGI